MILKALGFGIFLLGLLWFAKKQKKYSKNWMI